MRRGGTSGPWRKATRRDARERTRPQTNRCSMHNARGYYHCKCMCKEITLRGGKSLQDIHAVNLRPYFQQRLQNFKILRVHSGMQRVLEPPPTLPLINEPPSALSLLKLPEYALLLLRIRGVGTSSNPNSSSLCTPPVEAPLAMSICTASTWLFSLLCRMATNRGLILGSLKQDVKHGGMIGWMRVSTASAEAAAARAGKTFTLQNHPQALQRPEQLL